MKYNDYMWYDSDVQTPDLMTRHLANVQRIREVFQPLPTTPMVPRDMLGMNVAEANNIEKILLDVHTQYKTMLTTRVAAGMATSGGDYL